MEFFRLIRHLLPRAEAWRITRLDKCLTQFFIGLATWLEAATTDITKAGPKHFFDKIYEDLFPATTRQLTSWEEQFNLSSVGLTEGQRRDALLGAWRAQGGQDPKYIQDLLHSSGFPQLFVHEWWQDPDNPTIPPTPRNAYNILELGLIDDASTSDTNMQTEALHAQCEDDHAQTVGPVSELGVSHYALKNLYNEPTPTIPNDTTKFPFFYYIAGESWVDNGAAPPTVTIPAVAISQKNDLEKLLLKVSPTQQWIGIIVSFT